MFGPLREKSNCNNFYKKNGLVDFDKHIIQKDKDHQIDTMLIVKSKKQNCQILRLPKAKKDET